MWAAFIHGSARTGWLALGGRGSMWGSQVVWALVFLGSRLGPLALSVGFWIWGVGCGPLVGRFLTE